MSEPNQDAATGSVVMLTCTISILDTLLMSPFVLVCLVYHRPDAKPHFHSVR